MKHFKELDENKKNEVLQDLHREIAQQVDIQVTDEVTRLLESAGYASHIHVPGRGSVRIKEWSGGTIVGVIPTAEIKTVVQRMLRNPLNLEESTPLKTAMSLNSRYGLTAVSDETGVRFSRAVFDTTSYLQNEGEYMMRDTISLTVLANLIKKDMRAISGFLESYKSSIQHQLWSDDHMNKRLDELKFDENGNRLTQTAKEGNT